LKKHLSFANVMSCVALFMALSGVAYAATLGKNAVKTKNIANGAVTAAKIKNSSVTAAKLANGAVIGSKIANGAVGASKLAEASVRSSALGGGVVTTGKLKDLSVTEGKLANSAVTGAKLGASSVETGKLAKESVTGEKLSVSLLGQLVKNVIYPTAVTSVVDDTTEEKSATAECPAGKEAIGGGARVVGTEVKTVALTQSSPSANLVTGKTTGWFAQAREIAPEGKAWGVEVHVVCAEL
jgi:hypothetical protein